MKRLLPVLMMVALAGVVYLNLKPALSKADGTWQRVGQATPTRLQQQLRKDYASRLRPGTSIDVTQMQMVKLQQPGSLPLYLINTRIHPRGQPGLTPTCGVGGCLFFGYIPDKGGFKQVLNGVINDFQVQGAPPVIQPVQRVLNQVPCFQLTAYNTLTQKLNPTRTLCFNGQDFVPAGNAAQ